MSKVENKMSNFSSSLVVKSYKMSSAEGNFSSWPQTGSESQKKMLTANEKLRPAHLVALVSPFVPTPFGADLWKKSLHS